MPKKLDELAGMLAALAKQEDSPITYVTDETTADWLVRLEGDEVLLVPASATEDEREGRGGRRAKGPAPPRNGAEADGSSHPRGPGELVPSGGPGPEPQADRGGSGGRELRGKPENEEDLRPRAVVEVLGPDGKAVEGEAGRTFYHHDRVNLRIRNPSRVAVDVTVLYLDSKFEITSLFPTVRRASQTGSRRANRCCWKGCPSTRRRRGARISW